MVDDTPALAVEGLAKRHGSGIGAVDALAGVDLAFARGTFTAIMGPSGSGKSTFLACVAGLERPTSGRVLLEGTDVTHWKEARRPLDRLTDREREVLTLMAEGRSNAAIATRLCITEKAVDKHINNIFTKLDLPPAPDDNRRVLAVLAWLNAG